MPDSIPPPKQTLESLTNLILSIFSIEQAEYLFNRFKEIQTQGYGRVTIIFSNGHPDIIERTETEKLPKTYKPE